MNDLFQSAVGRDEFQRWLGLGTAPFTVWQGEKAVVTLSRLEKNPSVDYLYRIGVEQDNSISWNSSMLFCGAYDREHRTLYLTRDSLRILMDGKFPLVTEGGSSMAEEISSCVNERVEGTIANDRNNLPIQEITDWQASRDLEYYRNHGVKESAVRQIFSNQEPDGQFHSDYKLSELPETAFIAYITDPELFVQTEAEQHIKNNQKKFLLQFLKNDALLAEYQALMLEDVSTFQHDGLTNLLFSFEGADLAMGRLAMWRLQTHEQFGGTWLSDYVPNRLGDFIQEQTPQKPECLHSNENGNGFKMEECLRGLITYAAGITASGQDDNLSWLRRLVEDIPEFWGAGAPEQYLTAFDQAVSEAHSSGQMVLSEQSKADILTGL